MPYVLQMLGCAITLIGLVLIVWLGFWVLLMMGMLSAGYWLWLWLVRKGILNPRPGVPFEEGPDNERDNSLTIIDGDFERVTPPDDPPQSNKNYID